MSTPINIKVTLANGTEQLNIAEPGKTMRIKAVGKGQFQLIDPKTGKTPDAFTAKRVGKDLLITTSGAEGAQADVVIEGFADAEGATLVGEASNGVFYEYIPTTDLGLTPNWAEGQAFSFATDQALMTSSALVGVPFFGTPLALLGAGAAGIGLANTPGATAIGATGATGGTDGGTGGGTGGGVNPGTGAAAIQAAVNRIVNAAQLNNAGPLTVSLADFNAAGITGVTAANLLVISSFLNSAAIDGAAVNSAAKIQALINAVNAVLGGAGTGPAPTLEQLQLLGLQGINADNLAAVQAAIRNTSNDGSGVDSIDELQDLIKVLVQSVQALSAIAQDDTATSLRPDAAAYAKAGITGVDASNLASINSVLNSSAIDGAAVDTPVEIQNLVNSYKAILAAADGRAGNPAQLTQAQYTQLGVTGINTPQKLGLLNEVIDSKAADGVDTQGELQELADAVAALMSAANGALGLPSLEQLLLLGVKGVTPANLEQVQLAIRNTDNSGSGVAGLQALQNLVPAVPPALGSLSALAAIKKAADDNNATEGKPTLNDYLQAGGTTNPGVTGVNAGNLPAINSLLNTIAVTGTQLVTVSDVQNLVNAYNKVLAAADGVNNNAPKPTQAEYLLMGITGVNSLQKASLLGDLLDLKAKGDVDSAADLQLLATAVDAVFIAAAGGAGPSLAQLKALGFTDLSPAQLAAVQAAIKTTPADGSGVDNLGELQALVTAVGAAFSAVADAALSNNATPTYPSTANYAKIGVTGVDGSNLAAINSILNRPTVNDVAVDTAAEIQALVDAYKAVLAAADGQANNGPLTRAQFEKLGITGIDTPQKENLLKAVIDTKTAADVDTAEELQKLADAVAAVAAAAAGGDGPSLEQLQQLGVKGVTPRNLAELQKVIRESNDDGSEADSLSDLQALVTRAQLAVPAVSSTGLAAIADAARTDNATEGKPSLADYRGAGTELAPDVTGVNAGNLAAINSILNTAAVGAGQVDTKEEIQQLVNAYNKLLAAADGTKDKDSVPTSAEYALLGIAGADTPLKQNLLGEVIDAKLKSDVDSASELQALADAVSALVAAATTAAGTGPSLEQLQKLGLQGVNPSNLAAVQLAIKKTPDDGSGVSELSKLQQLVGDVNEAFDTIRQAATSKNATETKPSAQDYEKAGITGVDASNLAAVNSVLNTPRVDGAAVDTAPDIQALVDAFNAVLNAADGQAGNGTAPTQVQLEKLGISGVDTPQKVALLGQVLDGKTKDAVDSVGELQELADAVAAVMAAAAGGSGPSLEQLQALGVSGVTPKNLAEVQRAIERTNNDGSGVDNLSELNALVAAITAPNGTSPAIPSATVNLAAITLAAQDNNASEGKPTLNDYLQAGGMGNPGVTGVNAGNLAAINSLLNTAGVNRESVDTVAEVQALVNVYNKVLAAADGKDDNDAKPTALEYALLGITGVAGGNEAAKTSLLGDAIDTKTKTDVDSAAELQQLADAAAAVVAGANPSNPAPSLEQLQSLGLKGLTPANLLAVQEAIKKSADNGSGLDSLIKVQGLVNGVNQALGAISNAAQDNKATESSPSADDYAIAGVTGVNAGNLAALNSALNTPSIDGAAVDTAPQIQALVNTFKAIFSLANGEANNGVKPTQAQYELLGVTGVNTPQKAKLLGEVLDLQTIAGVDSVAELQKLADAVSAVMAAAAGGSGPSLEQLQALGLSNVSPANLLALQTAIQGSSDDGSQVDDLSELRALVAQAQATVPPITATGLEAIAQAAGQNSAISTKPNLDDYRLAAVSNVTADNLAAINSALNTAGVTREKADSQQEVQALVNAYNKVLAAADGAANNAAKPTAEDYAALGISGASSAQQTGLLGEVIDTKLKTDVDSAGKLQKIAVAVATLLAAAADGPSPNLEQLQTLGLKGLNQDNLEAVQQAIKNSLNDGSEVDSLTELQNLVDAIQDSQNLFDLAFNVISDSAESNSATEDSPSAADYAESGVTGVDDSNLAALNSVLNTSSVDGATVDDAPKLQALVDAYQAVLDAADGTAGNGDKPTQAQYKLLGLDGVDTPQKVALLGQVLDGKTKDAVDSVGELQELADAVAAVMAAAAGGSGPSLEQLQALGVSGVTPKNLAEVQRAIERTNNDGSGVDNLSELNALVAAITAPNGTSPAIPSATVNLAAITLAAQDNNASEGKPTVNDYLQAGGTGNPGVTGVNADNLAAINSLLNTAGVNRESVDTVAEVQALVNAYNKVLAAADGKDDNDAKPTALEYALLGITGVAGGNEAAKTSLLGDAIDTKNKTDVDSAAELQQLADAAAAVVAGANPSNPAPSLEQLQALGLKGLNPANLAAVQAAIKASPADGSGVDSLDELQTLVSGVGDAFKALTNAAEANNATETNPSTTDYANAGATGVTPDNLAAINSALNTPRVDGGAVDTTPQVQALVDAYKAILAAADGVKDNGRKPTADEFALVGISGITNPEAEALLGEVIDGKTGAAVDTLAELQKLADAVVAVQTAAAGGSGPSLEQLQALGVTGVTPKNLAEVQKAIRTTADDGSEVDKLSELNALVASVSAPNGPVPAIPSTTINLAAITLAAQDNNATEGKPTLNDYLQAGGTGNPGVTGVNADNLAAINSTLNTATVNGESVNTVPEVQALVNAYTKVLAAADGVDNNPVKPTSDDYNALGITGLDSAPKLSLLGDVLDTKTKTEVDSAADLQMLADAVSAVMAGTSANSNSPSLEQLQALGLKGLNPANLSAIQTALKNSTDGGTDVDTLPELQALVNSVANAQSAISNAAQANNATDTSPSAADYAKAGVTGVGTDNLAAINSALNSPSVNGAAVDSTPEIQALVDAFQSILAAADNSDDNDAKPTLAAYALVGVNGVNTPQKQSLLGDAIDTLGKDAVDSVPELQKLADAVTAVMAAAAGGSGPSEEQLKALGIAGVTPANLTAVQTAIKASADDGTAVDTLAELQMLVTTAAAPTAITTTGLAAITQAAQANNATEGKPSLTDYLTTGVSANPTITGVTADNLAAINSALNTPSVNGEKTDTVPEVQALVNAYLKVLAAADGNDDNDAKPTAADYALLGITGITGNAAAAIESLLGDVLDLKAKADVDSAAELQKLADAVAAVVASAAPGAPNASQEQLQALGLSGLNPANLAAVQAAIKGTPANGSGVDSLPELQALVNGVANAQKTIIDAAQANSATETSPSAADYAQAGVKGVDASNLAAINSALNTPTVDGSAVDSTPEIQALVDAYKAVLAAADGTAGNGVKPTQAQFAALGISGVDTQPKQSLLGDVVDSQAKVAVDTAPELQKLADAVAAVMAAAAGGSGPSEEQLKALGIAGVTPANLAAVQTAIKASADDGTAVDTLAKLQPLVTAAAAPTLITATGLDAITRAAQADNATEGKPSLTDYLTTGVSANPTITGVTADNLAAINSALNTPSVNGEKTDTVPEVQALVNAYLKVLAAADSTDNNAAKPTAAELGLLGITGITGSAATAIESLLGDVLDLKAKADVDTASELQKLADAVAAVIASTAPNASSPSLEQLQALGLSNLNAGNLPAVQAAIKATTPDGLGVDTLPELQSQVNGVEAAFNAISDAAQANKATETSPSADDYAKAGITGVFAGSAGNLATINSALNTPLVNGAAVDTAAEIQALVNAYNAILFAADSTNDDDRKPTAEEYALVGISGVTTPQKESLLGDVIDVQAKAAVDTAPELQKLADAVAAVMAAAAGGSGPSEEQLKALGIAGVTPANLAAVQTAIKASADDGTAVDTLAELQTLVTAAAAPTVITTTGLAAITQAAQANNATEGKPSLTDYLTTGVAANPTITGVTADNLAAINSALNTPSVNGEKTDTVPEVQALVNAYIKVLAAANGAANPETAKPTEAEYLLLGVTGTDSTQELSLLGDVLDLKAKADVDSAAELQKLADAVAAVIAGANAANPAPSLEQLQALGLTGLNPANLAALQDAIRATQDNGSEVDTLPKLQALLGNTNTALGAISAAAEANNASATTPSADAYAAAGVTGVTGGNTGNLAAINSALNTPSVNGAAVDTAPEIQALVNAYQAVLAAADATNDDDRKPTTAEYALIGVNGVNTPQKESLLGDVVDLKPQTAVDTVPELQALADAVAAVMSAANGGATPSLAQLQQDLGLTEVTPANLAAVLAAIAATDNDGSQVDTLDELKALISQLTTPTPPAPPTLPAAITRISTAAQNNTADPTSPSVSDYVAAGVTDVTANNLGALNSALNSGPVNGAATDTTAKIQALVNAYQAILAAADGQNNTAVDPTQAQFTAIGVTGVDSAPEESLLGDVVDRKTNTDVATVRQIQDLANAVAAVITAAADGAAPTLADLRALGLSGVSENNLALVQAAIRATNNDGTEVNTVPKLQALINNNPGSTGPTVPTFTGNAISNAAQNNNATSTTPSAADYALLNVTGVSASNTELLGALASALNSAVVDGPAADTTAEVQELVNAYAKILADADGINNVADTAGPTQAQLSRIGVLGADTAAKVKLLGDVIDTKATGDVNTVAELQVLADAVAAVMANAANSPTLKPTSSQLQALGVTGVNDGNLIAVQAAIAATNDTTGQAVDTVAELQALVNALGRPTALNRISTAAEANTADPTTPSVSDYMAAGVTDVTANNLGAMNSALNSVPINAEATNSTPEIQALVNAYRAILAAADGSGSNTNTDPTKAQFEAIGVTGLNGTNGDALARLLGDVVDRKANTDVATVPQIQALANIAAAVITAAAPGGTIPTVAQLTALGLSGVTEANLTALRNAILATDDTGAGVDTVQKLQDLVNNLVPASTGPTFEPSPISNAAQNNNATPSTPTAADYATLGVTGVNAANTSLLGALANALNSAGVDGPATDTTAEVQELVNAYAKILADADGINNEADDAGPTQLQFSRIGVVGVDSAFKAKLLGDVIDNKAADEVNTVAEVQVLADAVGGVLGYAARQGTGDKPSLLQLLSLGLVDLNNGNLADLQAAVAATAVDGSGVNTVPKLQALLNGINQEKAINKIEAAAQANNAKSPALTLNDYTIAGATDALQDNVASYNDALDRPQVTGADVNSTNKIAQLVAAYNVILASANGAENITALRATQAQYLNLGVTGVSDANRSDLLSDVVDIKAKDDVNTVQEIQNLANAVSAVLAGANGGTTSPTLPQLLSLGLTDIDQFNLQALQASLKAQTNLGAVNSRAELQALISDVNGALLRPTNPIPEAAQNNSADGFITVEDYEDAGQAPVLNVKRGVDSKNLESINSVLDSDAINAQATNTQPKLTRIVTAYNRILAAADESGSPSSQLSELTRLNQADFNAVNLPDIDSAIKANLMGDAVDRSVIEDVGLWEDLQFMARAVSNIIASASGQTIKPSISQLNSLPLDNIEQRNLSAIQAAIAASSNAEAVDTIPELQALIDGVNQVLAIDKIKAAAAVANAVNNASTNPIAFEDYEFAGLSARDPAILEIDRLRLTNLDSYNDALYDTDVTAASVSTKAQIQALVTAYNKVLAAADGDRTTPVLNAPSATDFSNIGINGLTDTTSPLVVNNASLLSDAIGAKNFVDVDRVNEIQALADAASAVMNYAALATAPNPASATAPTKAQLEALGVRGITDSNLIALQNAIANTANDGSAVNTVPKLQLLIGDSNIAVAINKIADAAAANNATAASIVLADYITAGAASAAAANVSAYNDVLNTPFVNRDRADTEAEIVGLVNTYNKVLAAANGTLGNAPVVSATEYTNLGVTGLEGATPELLVNKTDLLNDAIDAKAFTAVDQVSELQALASAAIAIMNLAALPSDAVPTPDQANTLNTQLGLLGVTGINTSNLRPLLTAIVGTADNGSAVDSVLKIQNLVEGNTDVTPPTVRSVAIQSATTNLGAGFNKVTDEGDTVTFRVTMSETVTVTGSPTLAFLMGGTPKTATFSSASGTDLIFTYNVVEGDFDHNGISLPAGTSTGTTGLVGGSIQDGNNNVANRSYDAVSDQAAFRVDALSLDANNGTSNGLLIKGVNSGGQWFFAWDTNANGTMFASSNASVDIGDQRPFRSADTSLLTPLRALRNELNPNIEINLITPAQYQTIAANNGWPTANWSSTNQTFWAFDSNLDDGSQAFFRARSPSLNDTVNFDQTTLLTSFAVI